MATNKTESTITFFSNWHRKLFWCLKIVFLYQEIYYRTAISSNFHIACTKGGQSEMALNYTGSRITVFGA